MKSGARRRGARWVVVAVAMLAAVAIGGSAEADGGSYPSGAPTISPGQTVTGGAIDADTDCDDHIYQCAGRPGVQYYRLLLGFGDKATFDFHAVAGQGVSVCVMSPSTTDYNVADAECLAYGSTADTKFGELDYTAGQSASYVVAVSDFYTTGESWGYALTASVASRVTPALKLKTTKRAHVGQTIKLHGSISPATANKKVTLRAKSPAHGWIQAGTTKTDSRGHFAFTYHLGHSGPHEFRASFAGKGQYDPATSKTVKVKVGG